MPPIASAKATFPPVAKGINDQSAAQQNVRFYSPHLSVNCSFFLPHSLLDHSRPNHAVAEIIEHDLVIFVYFTKGEFAVKRNDDGLSPRANKDYSIVFNSDRCHPPDLGMVRLFAPSFRKTRIALELETVSLSVDADDDPRAIWLPLRPEPWVSEPSA
jgi:hypothetical protein